MTVATETAVSLPLSWTGVESVFSAGFTAYTADQISVVYDNGTPLLLTQGVHYSVAIAGSPGAVTVTPLAFPAAPAWITVRRNTLATQGTPFTDLAKFPAKTHERLHDLSAMRDAELKRDLGGLLDTLNAIDVELGDVALATATRVYPSIFGLGGFTTAVVPPNVQTVSVLGCFSAGDGGADDWKHVLAVPAHGCYITSANGRVFEYAPRGKINLLALGAKRDLSVNCSPILSRAFDFSHARPIAIYLAGARPVAVPIGNYRFDDPVVKYLPIVLEGESTGHGAGLIVQTDYGAVFWTNFLTGNLISVDHYAPSTVTGILFDTHPNVRPRTGGAALYFTSSQGGTGANPRIENCAFTLQYHGIHLHRSGTARILHNIFGGWINNAIRITGDAQESGAGFINLNVFSGEFASQVAAIYSESGYVKITENVMVGANIAVWLNIKNAAAGAPEVCDNQIEEQISYGVLINSSDGSPASMFKCEGNQFSGSSTVIAHVAVLDYGPGADWIDSVRVCGNVFRTALGNSGCYIRVGSGIGIAINDNEITHFGVSSATGIECKGAAIKTPAHVINNRFALPGGGSLGRRYDIAPLALMHDPSLPLNMLPANCADGSTAFISDGAPGSSPVTAGAGTFAIKRGGTWHATGTMAEQNADAVAITGGSALFTSLGVKSTLTAYNLLVVSVENLTANRSLFVELNNADRALSLNGNVVFGGPTTLPVIVAFDVWYASANDIMAKLAANTAATKKFFSMTGTGAAGQAPAWSSVAAGDVVGLGTMATQNADAVAITGGSALFTSLGVKSTLTAFNLLVVSTENLTANRSLFVELHDANRALSLNGNVTFGGPTTLPAIAAFDTWYASAADIMAKLAANTTATKKFFSMTGTGAAGAAPAWSTVTAGDVGLGNVDNTSDASKNAAAVTLTNHTLDNSNTATLKDTLFTLQDDGNATRQMQFQLSGISAGQTRVVTARDANGTLAYLGDKLSAFAPTTSAELASVISDETGTGPLVLADSPVHTTRITTPKVTGGSAANSTLVVESTSGAGTSDKIIWQTGSQVHRGEIATGGQVSFGPTAPGTASVDINQNTSNALSGAAAATPLLRLSAADGTISVLEMDSYGAAVGNQIAGVIAGGTQAAPSATANGKVGFNLVSLGHDGTAFGTGAYMQFYTAEAWGATAHGMGIRGATTPIGSTANGLTFAFHPEGSLSVGSWTAPGAAGAIGATAFIKAATYLLPGSYTVAGLPAGVTGAMVYCSNLRVFNGAGVQEGAGAGTGGHVTYNGTAWKISGTNVTAVA